MQSYGSNLSDAPSEVLLAMANGLSLAGEPQRALGVLRERYHFCLVHFSTSEAVSLCFIVCNPPLQCLYPTIQK